MGNNINNNSKIVLNDSIYTNNNINYSKNKKYKIENEDIYVSDEEANLEKEDKESEEEQNKIVDKADERNEESKEKIYIKEILSQKDKNISKEISSNNNKENILENHKFKRKNFDNISVLINLVYSFILIFYILNLINLLMIIQIQKNLNITLKKKVKILYIQKKIILLIFLFQIKKN